MAWTTDDLDEDGGLVDLVVDDGRIVAVGYRHWEEPAISAVVVSDDDGQTWQPAPDTDLDTGRMVAVTDGPAGFVAVGRAGGGGPEHSAAIWASVDGFDWQAIDPPTRLADADLAAVIASADRYVAGGADGWVPAVFVSFDGVTWREAAPFYEPADYGTESIVGDQVTALAVRDGHFVAALSGGAHRGEIWASDDGLSWAPIGIIESIKPAYTVSGMTWDETGLLAIGSDLAAGKQRGYIWASTDGAAWNVVAPLGPGSGVDLAIGPAGYFALSAAENSLPSLWTSVDGLAWTEEDLPFRGTPSSIMGALIALDDGYLGVGSRGNTVDDVKMILWHGSPAP